MASQSGNSFLPHPALPQDPEFYRRVLQACPAPLFVVDREGVLTYCNSALERMSGWDTDSLIGNNILDFLHPDEVDNVVAAFLSLVSADAALSFEDEPWAPIQTRIVAANGQIIPVVVTGIGGLDSDPVHGIIYDIRPAHEQDILRRGLTGLAQGEPIDNILTLITDMISLPPLNLDAAVLAPIGDGSYRVIGSTSDQFLEILEAARDPQPWNSGGVAPARTIVSRFPGEVGEDLFAAGYREFWHVSPESSDRIDAYRIVAAARRINEPGAGEIDRLSRANELAGVVLLRARADALLEHSATHDRLTQLSNRDGFHRRAKDLLDSSTSESAALLFIDLDGFKQVNDAHGHLAGDAVLEAVASRLVSVTRKVDLVARLGGDEFVILVGADNGRPANRARVQVICDRALQELRREIEVDGAIVQIAASIGATIGPADTPIDRLLAEADAAMYTAKRLQGGRSHIVEL